MPINLPKRYNELLDLIHYNEFQRTNSLRAIFNRDIAENPEFKFRDKIIRPLVKENVHDVEQLFDHLTKKSVETTDENGKIIKSRNMFDMHRSRRLHWIWYHIQEKKQTNFEVFSCSERKNGTDVIHTYLLDTQEDYVIVLEPHRSTQDYYLLTAYHLDEKWSRKSMQKKIKRKLSEVY